MKLNLGSGNEPLAGHVNVDRRPAPGVDVVADVQRLPFAARSVETVIASSLLEHFEARRPRRWPTSTSGCATAAMRG